MGIITHPYLYSVQYYLLYLSRSTQVSGYLFCPFIELQSQHLISYTVVPIASLSSSTWPVPQCHHCHVCLCHYPSCLGPSLLDLLSCSSIVIHCHVVGCSLVALYLVATSLWPVACSRALLSTSSHHPVLSTNLSTIPTCVLLLIISSEVCK